MADLIRAESHADIGADHAHLLATLLFEGRISKGIAIENKPTPFANATDTLRIYPDAEVRFADGLAGLREKEVDSLSICGMGGLNIMELLSQYPTRVPPRLLLQPNCHAAQLRDWARQHGYHLTDEVLVGSTRKFLILAYRYRPDANDPAFQDLDLNAALEYGPLLIRRNDPKLHEQLLHDRHYIEQRGESSKTLWQRLPIIRHLLANWDHSAGFSNRNR